MIVVSQKNVIGGNAYSIHGTILCDHKLAHRISIDWDISISELGGKTVYSGRIRSFKFLSNERAYSHCKYVGMGVPRACRARGGGEALTFSW